MKIALLTLGLCGVLSAPAQVAEITLPGERLFTESITSTSDGTLILGSLGKGNVSRITPGSVSVDEFIPAGTNGLHAVSGVYADERHGTLYVCSNQTDAGVGVAELKSFDLQTGAPKYSYTLPGTQPFCNDIATAEDGATYITDTRNATVLLLRPGAKGFEIAANDPLLASAEGLAFGDKRTLYVNGVNTGRLVRMELGRDGKAVSVIELKLPMTLVRPDGMRALGRNKLLLAENGGSMDIVTVDPKTNSVKIVVLKSGLQSTPAVTATRGMAWIAEGKLEYLNDPTRNPGAFKLYAVPLPGR